MINVTVDEKTDSGLFAHNDLFDIVTGVKYAGRKWILFKNLEANAVNNADHRDGGLIPALVARLVESFSRGVRFGVTIPVVEMFPTPKKYIDENDNVEYYYARLVDEIGRAHV